MVHVAATDVECGHARRRAGASIFSGTWSGPFPFLLSPPCSSVPSLSFPYLISLSPYICSSPLPPSLTLPEIQFGVWGRLSSPSGVLGGAPAANAFACILGREIAAGGDDFPSWWSEMFTYDAIWVSITPSQKLVGSTMEWTPQASEVVGSGPKIRVEIDASAVEDCRYSLTGLENTLVLGGPHISRYCFFSRP